ncbi:MAG: putative MarR-family transcriptional regulator [Actinomycetia bacterium]|nr:putative MarR-family transcriptional regulator [Actinomycetes bacterium]
MIAWWTILGRPLYSSAMPASRDRPSKPAAPPAAGSPAVDDLTWLAYRAAGALGEAFNKVSRDAGLADLRDWLVLALISGDATQRTQLEIATHLGIDKSTLVPLLDRLERDGLIIRATSERDRRVRIPQATPAGLRVVKEVAIARDAAINDRLAAIPPAERASFHATLWRIVEAAATPQ